MRSFGKPEPVEHDPSSGAVVPSRTGSAPAVLSLREGELVAQRFMIERLSGLGGMGAVYRAFDLERRRPAAVKVIASRNMEGTSRFASEAKLLAKLSHPAIVRYLAHGTTDSHAPFLAMEWLEGKDLAAHLKSEPLSIAQSFALIRRICSGLALAHRHGIVHRDVKPSNVFLPDGDPCAAKLLDFGVALPGTRTRVLTKAGSLIGTVGYMAPEQAMGVPDVDARADVFAIGCVLFEMLTGRAAFAAPHEVAVLGKVLREDPPRASELRPGLGESIDTLLGRMLAKDRQLRPPDAEAVLRALGSLELPALEPPMLLEPPASAGPIDAEQRIVSVILGSGASIEPVTMSSEDAARAAEQLDQLASLFHADVSTLQGGGLLIVLGDASADNASDQAMQAARLALRLRLLRPELSLAVATGTFESTGRVPVGAAIDRAAALLERASHTPPRVLIDELTAGLIGAKFDLLQQHGVLALIGELDEAEVPRLLMGRPTPCVGRNKELALLEATLTECIEDGVARAILISAPPGVGKSRLGHEFLALVRARGSARVLVARADPVSAGSALGLLLRLVRYAVGLRNDDDAALQQRRIHAYLEPLVPHESLARLVEFLAEMLGAPINHGASSLLRTARADAEVMREQNRRTLSAWLDAESAQRALVLLFEDLHWGDLPSVAYLEDALRMFSQRPIMVVALARPEVRETFPRFLASVDAHELRLQGLTRRAAERLVSATLSSDTAPAISQRIVDLAEGNAFYLEELIRRAAEGGTEFPETVVAMVQSRLSCLDADARRLLRAASVFGPTAWVAGVQTLLESSESCESTLELLVREEILVPRAQSRFTEQQEYAFRHALLHEAAYATLAPANRALAHKAAGAWLQAHGERDARVLADHFELGRAPTHAIPWLVRAALAATEGGDFSEAIALARRGLALGATGHHRGTLLLVSSTAASWGEHATADMDGLREALDLLPHASSQWWLAVSGLIWGASAIGDAQAGETYLGLAATTPPGPELTGYYGQSLQTLASSSVLVGQPEIGWSLVEQFDAVAADDPSCDQLFLIWRDIARTFLAVYSSRNGAWQLEQALGWAESSVHAMNAAGSGFGESIASYMLGTVLLFTGAYRDAEAAFERSMQSATKYGTGLMVQYSALLRSWSLVRLGRLDEAERGLACCVLSGDHTIRHGVLCVQAELAARTGQHATALRDAHTASSGPAAPYRRMAWHTLARVYLQMGLHAQVIDAVASASLDGNPVPNLEFEGELRLCHARALIALGEHESARRVLRQALAFVSHVADQLHDPERRRVFLDEVEPHRALRELASQWLSST